MQKLVSNFDDVEQIYLVPDFKNLNHLLLKDSFEKKNNKEIMQRVDILLICYYLFLSGKLLL